MINSHLLYQTELSFVQETGIEPMPSGFTPMLSMSYVLRLPSFGGTRNRRPARASRDLGEPGHMA